MFTSGSSGNVCYALNPDTNIIMHHSRKEVTKVVKTVRLNVTFSVVVILKPPDTKHINDNGTLKAENINNVSVMLLDVKFWS